MDTDLEKGIRIRIRIRIKSNRSFADFECRSYAGGYADAR